MLDSAHRRGGPAWIAGDPEGGRVRTSRPSSSAPDETSRSACPLPLALFDHLEPLLERVPLRPRQILHERHMPVAYAYFLESGVASLLSRSESGAKWMEIATLGRGDVSGLCLALGNSTSPHRCTVLIGGHAWRISAQDLREALDGHPDLQRLLLRHVHTVLAQTAQVGVCNARHALRQRLARWLLLAHDGLDGDEIAVTHAVLARVLGVRRAGITTAIGRLEAEKRIQRGRGRVLVTDRAGLESEACECCRMIRTDRRRLLCEEAPRRETVTDGLAAHHG